MFYDLDIVATPALAKTMTNGIFPLHVQEILKLIMGVTADMFTIEKTIVTLCISNTSKKTADGVKVGIHLTYSSIFVTTAIALHVRSKVLEKLAEYDNPFQNMWDDIVDAAVHKGSGMRLPWAAKPKEPQRVYVPRIRYFLERGTEICEEHILDVAKSFSAVRAILMSVSLRTRGTMTHLIHAIDTDLFDSPSCSGIIRNSSVVEYATIIKEIENSIPEEYDGHITGVLKTKHVYMFRHSSKYCANVDRHHTSSNTYFLVSPSGMRQCCYSRKVEFEEKSCPCSHFRGDLIKLPKKIISELFPESIQTPPRVVSIPMPSDKTDFTLDRLVECALKKTPHFRIKKPKN
jgi:hypothetical protein